MERYTWSRGGCERRSRHETIGAPGPGYTGKAKAGRSAEQGPSEGGGEARRDNRDKTETAAWKGQEGEQQGRGCKAGGW